MNDPGTIENVILALFCLGLLVAVALLTALYAHGRVRRSPPRIEPQPPSTTPLPGNHENRDLSGWTK